jgi:hypothetical protein
VGVAVNEMAVITVMAVQVAVRVVVVVVVMW